MLRRPLLTAAITAALLTMTAVPASADLVRGDRGTSVEELQRLLRMVGERVGVDGVFGPATERAVRRYERRLGLRVDGRVSDPQLRALRRRAWPGGLGDRVLRRSMRGDDVRVLQGALTRLGLKTAVDGVYGRNTERRVRSYERRTRLRVDGRVTRGQARGVVRRLMRDGVDPARLARRVGARREKAPAQRSSGYVSRVLQLIAECESGGNPRAVSPDGKYRGKYQMLRSTWRSLGGEGDPAKAPEAEQDERARALYEARGARPWPTCGPKAEREAAR